MPTLPSSANRTRSVHVAEFRRDIKIRSYPVEAPLSIGTYRQPYPLPFPSGKNSIPPAAIVEPAARSKIKSPRYVGYPVVYAAPICNNACGTVVPMPISPDISITIFVLPLISQVYSEASKAIFLYTASL